jgi:hypothetical protein
MVDTPSSTRGLLTLDTTTNVTDFNISLEVPLQTIILRSYRVQFNTAGIALGKRIIYVSMPFLSGNQLIDGNPGFVMIPLPLENTAVTLESSLELPIYLSSSIPRNFTMSVYNSDYTPCTDLESISLQFELSRGHLT